MTFESFIARRYLSARNKPFLVSLVLFLTLFAVATGVFALIFVLAVMNGFERDFRTRILGFKAPITVSSESGEDLTGAAGEWQRRDPRIRRVVPFVEGEAIVQSAAGAILGVRVRGITESPSESRVGRLYESDSFGETSILIGQELASTLRVHPDFFEKISLIFPFGDVGPTGEMMPRMRQFTLTGMFRSGFYEFDSKYVLVPYRQAVRLFGREARTGLEVWVEPFGAVEEVRQVLQRGLAASSSIKIATWRDQNPKLFAAMKMEKIGMFLLLVALLLIASFNIFGLTALSVMEKIRDMAVLRSVGLSPKRVARIFLLKAAGIGFAGAIAGGVVGLFVTFLLRQHPIRLPSTYYLENLPILVEPKEVLFVLLLVPVLTTLAALYPAYEAGRLSPVEVLRYE